jgi:hypothetical protein
MDVEEMEIPKQTLGTHDITLHAQRTGFIHGRNQNYHWEWPNGKILD